MEGTLKVCPEIMTELHVTHKALSRIFLSFDNINDRVKNSVKTNH